MAGVGNGYDYVVVGAGSAGCVLAARLSEDPATRVLLLGTGPVDEAEQIRMPAAAPTPPRGRTLAGSSTTNAMIYVRGSAADFTTWRDRYGCPGWGYGDLLPYFRRAEDQLRLERPKYVHELQLAWLSAAREYGLPASRFHPYRQEGVGFFRVMQRAGRRWSAADAYLRPASGRRNLTVVTGAQVSRVLIERGRAVGVRCRYGETEYEVRAAVEVMLCGGAVNTPHLLMLSGIGPAGHLRRRGIEVVADSAQVGTGLQDHPLCAVMWYTPRSRGIWEEATEANIDRWRRQGRGPMASLGAEAGGFTRTAPGLPAPDVQFHVVPAPVGDPARLPPDPRVVSVLVCALDVESRGRIRLRCADPAAAPVIDPGLLAVESDLAVLAAGVRQAREIAGHSPLAELVEGEFAPGERIDDKDGLRAWLRRTVSTIHHPTSSCAMGGTPGSACDPELRVRGVERLRVVDASVMPTVPRGNPNASTIAVAERAADLIRHNRPLTPTSA